MIPHCEAIIPKIMLKNNMQLQAHSAILITIADFIKKSGGILND